MKAYGQEIADYDTEDPTILELGEVSIIASPAKLREIAKFINECADHWNNGSDCDHFHFNRNVTDRPQFVLVKEGLDD